LLIRLALGRSTGQVRRTYDDDVLGDDWCRVQPDFPGHQIHDLIVIELQVYDAVFAEALNRLAGFGVERDHLVARRDVDDPVLAAVGPVRETPPGELARGRLGALAFVEAVDPFQLTGLRVERHHGAARAGCRVQPAFDHERRGLQV